MMHQQLEILQKLVVVRSKREVKKNAMEQLKLTKLTDQNDIEPFLMTFERMMGCSNRKEEMGIHIGTSAAESRERDNQ